MKKLLATTDPVLISAICALLKDEGIVYAVFDANMSIMEGSIGVLPRRIMVEEGRLKRAKWLLDQAGIDHES